VSGLVTAYEELQKRLGTLPAQRDWLQADLLPNLRADAANLRERLNSTLPTLTRAEEPGTVATAGEHHCAACGHAVAPAPFCSHCGSRQAVEATCGRCGSRTLLPMHLLAEGGPAATLFCTHCGTAVAGPA
jgi:hypothetical protein